MTSAEKQIINNQIAIFNLLGYLVEVTTGKKPSVMMEIEPFQIIDTIPNTDCVTVYQAAIQCPGDSAGEHASSSQPRV